MSDAKNAYVDDAIFMAKVNRLKSIYTSAEDKILVSHIGDFNQDKINSIASLVENQLELMATSKKIIKKIFNVVIETLQNINFHGEKDEKSVLLTYFLVAKKENEYNIYSGNLIKSVFAEKLNKRLTTIKGLNEEDLKKEYMEVLSNGELSDKGGAGLGFLTIALKSDNNIDFDFEEINKTYTLFSLHSKVKD